MQIPDAPRSHADRRPHVSADGRASFWPLHVAGWTALGLAMWVGVLPYAERPALALAHKAVFAATGGALALALRPLYRRLHRRRASVPALAAVTAACSYGLSLVWSAAYKLGVEALDAVVLGDPVGPLSAGYLFFDMTLFYSFILVAWSVLYVGAGHLADAQRGRERAIEAEGLAHQARLEALRYQLDPHFLFNTLNVLSTLVAEERTRDAGRMIARLSDFLRLTLDRGTAAEVPLADELDFARRYLDVERVRFGDRLLTSVDADPGALGAAVPPLILQPLVENALRHGVLSREEGGAVRVEVRRTGDRIVLRVQDDGAGPPAPGAGTPGVGLSNVRARLAAAFGDAAALRLERLDGGGCVARIDAPFRAVASSAPRGHAVSERVGERSDPVAVR